MCHPPMQHLVACRDPKLQGSAPLLAMMCTLVDLVDVAISSHHRQHFP